MLLPQYSWVCRQLKYLPEANAHVMVQRLFSSINVLEHTPVTPQKRAKTCYKDVFVFKIRSFTYTNILSRKGCGIFPNT